VSTGNTASSNGGNAGKHDRDEGGRSSRVGRLAADGLSVSATIVFDIFELSRFAVSYGFDFSR
jgi:hypothetical protein